jgi:hypothetical protein
LIASQSTFEEIKSFVEKMRTKKNHLLKKKDHERGDDTTEEERKKIRNAWTKFQAACALTEDATKWINPSEPMNKSGSEKLNFMLLLAGAIQSFFFGGITTLTHNASHSTYSLINADGMN